MSENDKNNPNDAPGLGGAGAELDLGPIRARLEAATPGPWEWQEGKDNGLGEFVTVSETYIQFLKNKFPDGPGAVENWRIICSFGNAELYYPTQGSEPSEEDIQLIANAPTDIAALVAEVERLRREVNTMAWSSYDQIIDKRWSWDREFEPPYPDVWDGK